uniref:Aminopeptidase n=1 Tax=Aceria tosichella TaxID=561515 RepID=A0A6G1SDN0_9ACAR
MIASRLLSSIINTSKTIANIIIENRNYHKMAKQVYDDNKFSGVRLPTNIKPVHYDLHLKPNFEDFTFTGKVAITYKATADTKSTHDVVLHANDLKITEGHLKPLGEGETSTVNQLSQVTYSKTTETATLEFNDAVSSSGVINLVFTGLLNDKMKGFYRTTFKIGNTDIYAATTQFEATDARLAFPCWDEPAFKATFTVTLVIDKYLNVEGKQYERLALSNMPEVSRSGPDNEMEVKFEKSPIMSTYLLAFIVGPFEALEGGDAKRPIRVYTTPGKKEHGRFALDVAVKSLSFYEDYFGVDYPLPKMDLIAIPDFTSGAMENWGLVTYRETCLLVDSNNTATDRKQYVALVVAHELAHQWFGNLVTMEWWTHLWLNEGFASFMEYLCVDHIFPEWEMWSQFLTDDYSPAMSLDSLHNSHPIEVPVNHPSEIDEIFDAISYSKGAAVIRMLYNYIGDDNFRKGMKDYLTKFEYKNAVTEDLWDCLEAASSKPVRKLMSGWTGQKGFPWLSVDYSQVGDKVKLTITQNKFAANGQVPPEEADMSWMVPVSAITGKAPKNPNHICLLDSRSTEVTIDGFGDSWIKLNPGTIGLYRTAYPEVLAQRLWSAILDQTMPAVDRLGLQNDFFALCQAGKVSTVELLKLLQSFRAETVYTVWSSIDACLGQLSILLANTDYRDQFFAFGRALMTDIFKKLTWVPKEGERHTDAMTRALVINRLVAFGEKDVIEEAKKLYKAHVDKTSTIPADLRGAVYRAVATYGDDASFQSLFDIYKTAELSEEKSRAARALGFSKETARLDKVIAFALSDEVRNQDKIFFIIPIGVSNPPVAWKLLQDNKDYLRQKYETSHLMTRLVKFVTENFTNEEKAQEIEQFFKENKFPGTERTVQQSIEKVRLNASWLARDGEAIKKFLLELK